MQEKKDIKKNYYCLICGNETYDGRNICSIKCDTIYKNFYMKSNTRYNHNISIDGFCAFCGNPHKLIRSVGGKILNRHHECYAENSPFSIIQIINRKEMLLDEILPNAYRPTPIIQIIKRKEEERNIRELEVKIKENEEIRKKEDEINNPKFYNEETKLMKCPECKTYSLKYLNESKKWFCNTCEKSIITLKPELSEKEKYSIYKSWGIDALSELIGESIKTTKIWVGEYFENECTTIGDNCLYYGHFKETNVAKQITAIDDLFDKSKQDCNSLRNEINSFLDYIEDVQLDLSEAQQKLLDTNYIAIKQAIEALYKQIEDYVIAVANTDMTKGEKVHLRENGDNLLADILGETFDGFCWNYAKQNDLVGICTVPLSALNEIKQMFEDFKINFNELNNITIFKKNISESDLSSLERETILLIIQNNGIHQSSLRKQLKIDSKKCSRLVNKLIDKNLIHRIPELLAGRKTYRILIKNGSSQDWVYRFIFCLF